MGFLAMLASVLFIVVAIAVCATWLVTRLIQMFLAKPGSGIRKDRKASAIRAGIVLGVLLGCLILLELVFSKMVVWNM